MDHVHQRGAEATMRHTDTSEILLRGLRTTLDLWSNRLNGDNDALFWVLRMQLAETGLHPGVSIGDLAAKIPAEGRDAVLKRFRVCTAYFDDVRYAALEPVTQLWGTVVNGLRVAADSNRATLVQKDVFQFSAESLVAFFRAARERMEVADELYHCFKAMPAPECQALAALLNVHVDAILDVETMRRLVRLLDHEGPMSEEEQADLQSLSTTHLVDAAFRGLRVRA
jgi:hypothetical protein